MYPPAHFGIILEAQGVIGRISIKEVLTDVILLNHHCLGIDILGIKILMQENELILGKNYFLGGMVVAQGIGKRRFRERF